MSSLRFRRIATTLATTILINSVQLPVLAEGLNTLGGRLYNIGGLMRPAVVGRLAGFLSFGAIPTENEQRKQEIEDTLQKLADGTLKLNPKEDVLAQLQGVDPSRLLRLVKNPSFGISQQTQDNIQKLFDEGNKAGILFSYSLFMLTSHMKHENPSLRALAFDLADRSHYTDVSAPVSAMPREGERPSEVPAAPATTPLPKMSDLTGYLGHSPSDQGLANVQGRLVFVRARIRELEHSTPSTSEEKEAKRTALSSLRAEISELEKWTSKFNLRIEGTRTPEKVLGALQASFSYIQLCYNQMYSDDASLATYFYSISRNAELFQLSRNYLLSLDRVSGNIFQGLNPSIPPDEFVKVVRDEIAKRFSVESIRDARVAWTTEYYLYALPSPEQFMRLSDRERNAIDRIAMPDPMVAVAFRKFYQSANENNVFATPEETVMLKKLIVQNAARLYGLSNLNPLLVAQYFETLAHIAEVCQNNPNAFFQAVSVALTPNIDTLTRPVLDATSPEQLGDSNVTRVINRLSKWFFDLQGIDFAALSQYDRFSLLDRTVRINPTPPHDIRSLPPEYKISLVEAEPRGISTYPPHPLPYYLITVPPSPAFTAGGVVTTPTSYQGNLINPSFTALEVSSQTGPVGEAMRAFIDPRHPQLIPPGFAPGVYIKPLSSTRLLNEMMRLFVEWEKPGYSGKIIGGGAAGGLLIRPQSADSKMTMGDVLSSEDRGGGAIGSFVTPTGGFAFGGSKTEEGRTFAGVSAQALPLGKIPILGQAMHDEHELNLDSFAAGIQTTDTIETKRRMISTALSVWDPENPASVLFNLNNEETADGKSWTNMRYFYVDKEGSIFELVGQSNDFVELFNYLAGYHNNPFGSVPATYAWNVETELDKVKFGGTELYRGGGVTAGDVGKTALLAHAQAVPFIFGRASAEAEIAELDAKIKKFDESKTLSQEVLADPSRSKSDKDKANKAIADADKFIALATTKKEALQKTAASVSMQPLLMEFTLAGGHSVQKIGQTNVYEVSLPGKTLQLPEVTEAGKVELGRKHYVQDVVFTTRMVRSQDDATQVTLGGGFAFLPNGKEGSSNAYRLGFIVKDQTRHTRMGGGIYYEAMETNIEQTALMQALSDAEEAKRSIEGLHRVAVTLYGSKEGQNRFLLGGLAHVVPQFAERGEDLEHNKTFWRGIGFLRGIGHVARVDISRRSWIDQMQADYNTLVRDTGQDPRNSAALMSAFKAKYAPEMRKVFDNYYLGVTTDRSLSLEVNFFTREDGDKWIDQWKDTGVQSVHSRILYTWDTGFIRAFASLPMSAPIVTSFAGTQTMGVAGAGFGFDFLDGFWFKRLVFDAGVVLGYETLAEGSDKRELITKGKFAQAAQVLYSSMLEDSKEYHELQGDYTTYRDEVEIGGYVHNVFSTEVWGYVTEEVLHTHYFDAVSRGEKAVPPGNVVYALLKPAFDEFYKKESESAKNAMAEEIKLLDGTYKTASTTLSKGKFSQLPDDIRTSLIPVLSVSSVRDSLYSGIDLDPKEVFANSKQLRELSSALEKWYSSEKTKRAGLNEAYLRRLGARQSEDIASLQQGDFSGFSESLGSAMVESAKARVPITEEVLGELRSGKIKVENLSPAQRLVLQNALWEWFSGAKKEINRDFGGKFRTYLAETGYFIGDKTSFDIAAFAQYAENFKAFVILSQREREEQERQSAIYAGMEIRKGRAVVNAILGTDLEAEQGSAGVSFRYSTTKHTHAGVLGFLRSSVPTFYSHPLYQPSPYTLWPEAGVILFFTVGESGAVSAFTVPSSAGAGLPYSPGSFGTPEYAPVPR